MTLPASWEPITNLGVRSEAQGALERYLEEHPAERPDGTPDFDVYLDMAGAKGRNKYVAAHLKGLRRVFSLQSGKVLPWTP